MLALGLLGLTNAARWYSRLVRGAAAARELHESDAAPQGVHVQLDAPCATVAAPPPQLPAAGVFSLPDGNAAHAAAHELGVPHAHAAAALPPCAADACCCDAAVCDTAPPPLPALQQPADAPQEPAPQEPAPPSPPHASQLQRPCVQRALALLVGVTHGVSGPGGVLGVLPAVVLHDPARSATYLLVFFAASIVAMGAFAAAFGEVVHRCAAQRTQVPHASCAMQGHEALSTAFCMWPLLVCFARLGSADRSHRLAAALAAAAATASLAVGAAWLVLALRPGGLGKAGLR
jgi:hypothetical protein